MILSDMILSDLEFFLVESRCAGYEPPVRTLLVRLTTDSGVEGWGEGRVEWRPSELAARRDAILPVLAGRSVYEIEGLHGLAALKPPPLRAALEMASWDIVARAAGQPLCHLLGGGYRRRIPIAIRLCGPTPGAVARLSREQAERGFHCQLVPSFGVPEDDLETLGSIRHAAPRRTEIRFDGRAAYDLETAWRLCHDLEDQSLYDILDPIQSLDLVQMATLRRQTNTPLAVRRPIATPADVLAVVRSGAARHVVIDFQQVGGVIPARKCGAVAQAAGLSASICAGPSLGIAVAAMLQLVAATPAYSGANECGYPQLQDDLLVDPLDIIDGMLAVPQGPGLGVEIDRAKVERRLVE